MNWRARRFIRSTLTHLDLPLSIDPALPPGVSVGRHSFGYGVDTFQIYMEGARIEVGAFCSIHRESRVLAGSEHVTTRASTFPFNAQLFDPAAGNRGEAIDRGPTVIGNDVWIGIGAIILSGVTLGDGAVIGAGALVSKSVAPYAVVAGNPAQVIRYRYPRDVQDRLLALRWWEWSEEELRAARPWFTADVEEFLAAAEARHDARPLGDVARRLRDAAPTELTPDRAPSG